MRIISFDGGGIRGLFSLLVLRRLEAERPGFISACDLFAGTSVGGIIALALAAGLSIDELIDLFRIHPGEIFPRQGLAGKLRNSALAGTRYSNEGLAGLLRARFGSLRLGDVGKGALAVAFSLDRKCAEGPGRSWGPKFFHNLDPVTGDLDALCWKVALYTSAAPTYFPSVDGFIDGGVAVNDPSMCAYSLARNALKRDGRGDEHICLLSIGTLRNARYIDKDSSGWGLIEWSPYILPLLMDAQSGIAEYQCRTALGERYLRLNSGFPQGTSVGLDDIESLPLIARLAEELELTGALSWLDGIWAC